MAAATASGPPNVIMIGDCGTGKSTAVEKTTGENALEGALEDNMEVMKALNAGPVSLMLFTAKAEKRIEQVVRQVEDYLERFIDFSDLACMNITHMDIAGRKWTEEQICEKLNQRFGGNVKVVFSGKDTRPEELCDAIHSKLAAPRDFSIDSGNFLHYFKICRMDMTILRAIREKVRVYKKDVTGFQNQLNKWSAPDIPDQCFQFNTFMTNRIAQLQGELAGEFDWDMQTDKGKEMTVDQQIGYVAHLSSQLKAELFKIRTLLLQFHSNSEVSNLRKCPHCGLIWGKWEGCDGATTCGSRPSQAKQWRNGQQATFTFHPCSEPYLVERTAVQRASGNAFAKASGAGCGGSITWSTMQPVNAGDGWTLADLAGTAGGGMTISCVDVGSTTGAGQVSFERMFEAARQKAKSCCPKARKAIMMSGTFGGA